MSTKLESEPASIVRQRLDEVDISGVERQFNNTPLEYFGEFEGKYLWILREDKQTVTDTSGDIHRASFKVRGAEAAIRHSLGEAKEGVYFASAGNAGVGIAAAAIRHGLMAFGGVPEGAPTTKVNTLEVLGAKLEFFPDYDTAASIMEQRARDNGHLFIPAFDSYAVVAGQGTVAGHALTQAREQFFTPDYLLVSGGGGSLAAGCLAELNRQQPCNPQTLLVCTELEGSTVITQSLEAGRLVELESVNKFSDGTAVCKMGAVTLRIMQALGNHKNFSTTIITQEELEGAMVFADDLLDQMPEPAGAHGFAEFLRREEAGNYVVVCSGANIDNAKADRVRASVATRVEKSKHRVSRLRVISGPTLRTASIDLRQHAAQKSIPHNAGCG